MSKNIELHIFGQVLRLNCPEEQQDALRAAASQLEERVGELKERTGILQLDRILSIVALNLTFELQQEKQKSSQQDTLMTRIQQLDTSLSNALAEIGSDMQILGR
ncbi:cell division protein ZapA [Pasteurella testudinis DSM 23072]|uniref:Cell division protein ZapA n=1 Tax=Pasteurella testudinis DSM 23072 TaxID=1122938 RepID=A0A1W1URZ5_9PAST|nr:cell division protein ZapA [Pasteurella testudinis]SMB83898.1 cell division protein ZapA [Pasteurella testudinis DSM 23072]SUB50952.1 cell division protein ZapA [Pasteurella testudinis]